MRRAPAPGADSSWLKALRRTEARILLTILGALGALWGFLALSGEVREGETAQLDETLLLAFRTPGHLGTPVGPRWLQESARDVTALGGFTTLSLITVLATWVLVLLGRRSQALIFGATVVLAQACAELAKFLIDRPRPDIVPHQDLVYSTSFPSGHAMMTPVVYLTLGAILAAGQGRKAIKTLLLVGAALMAIIVGVSRVYLGVHWPSDVLAGWTLGAAIALAASLLLFKSAHAPASAPSIQPDSGARSPAALETE